MKTKKWPTLYKKTSTGKIQMWKIRVEKNNIFSESGQVDGKKIKSSDTIKSGKNIGRANATTKEEQAISEANSRWEQKKKKGYVESIDDAQDNKVNKEFVEGGYNPMLAKSFDKDSKHISFPCFAQPKLDGSRACVTHGKVWSRTRKPIISVPHIEAAIKEIEKDFPMLDGELYNHAYKEDFETLMHIIRQQKKPDPDHKLVEYHVYDVPSDKPFVERLKDLERLKEILPENSPIVVVNTLEIPNHTELMAFNEISLQRGYEGIMARNVHGPYEYKRSKHLQKIKVFEDAEFKIVGVEEGRGKLIGHASAFVCITEDGNKFKAKLKGKLSNLKEYLINFDKYDGQLLTVQYQGITNKNSVPRFPVGLRLREEE